VRIKQGTGSVKHGKDAKKSLNNLNHGGYFIMAMRINTNVMATNAQKNLGINTDSMAKSLQRLSSGLRINKAADDAAGLAIAGRLRVDVKSYVKAAENTSQANAMVQVAEGSMDQIENIMNRMKELATQASSTNTDSTGRARLNDEFAALQDEIDRIADSTKYGDTALLTGTFGAKVGTMAATLSAGSGVASSSSIDVTGHIGESGSAYTLTDAADTTVVLSNGSVTQTLSGVSAGAQTLNFDKLGVKITLDSNYADQDLNSKAFTVTNEEQKIQVGSKASIESQITLGMTNMKTTQEYGGGSALSAWDISAASDARNLLDSIDTAISFITEKRGNLGAIQNRLSYASANLSTTIENVSAAESTIRDVDMAAEMTSFTKNQILMQAGTAMLGQANMAPQQVLSLLG
jgi:flagellin